MREVYIVKQNADRPVTSDRSVRGYLDDLLARASSVIFTYRRDDLGVRIEQVDAAMREGMEMFAFRPAR